MKYRLVLVQPDDPSDEIRDDPDTYYRRAREAARVRAKEQLEEEARNWSKPSESAATSYATTA